MILDKKIIACRDSYIFRTPEENYHSIIRELVRMQSHIPFSMLARLVVWNHQRYEEQIRHGIR